MEQGIVSGGLGIKTRAALGGSSSPAYLRIANISKRYGNLAALSDVSIDCREGELLSLLGPSGSGKSTILKVLAGLEQPDGGEVELAGESLLPVPTHRRDIGVMFQNYALFPHMTTFENVEFPLRMRKKKDRTGAVMDALRMVSLEDRAQHKPSQLSGGQQQRVALARSIVFGPRLLLLDEPLSALDRKLREELQVELRDLQLRLGLTTINVTHDQEEAIRMSDRIAVLKDGQLRQVGTPSEIYNFPADTYVASFIGSNNLVGGSPVIEGGELVGLRVATGQVIRGSGARDAVAAAVKSEDISVMPQRVQPSTNSNVLTGKVQIVTFEGSRTVATVIIDGLETSIKAVKGAEAVERGDHVNVVWDQAAVCLVPQG